MFVDMKLISPSENAAMIAATEPWIAALLFNGEYKGWLLERDGYVVAGGGLHLNEIGPIPGFLRIGCVAHIANAYTMPARRQLGLARFLLEEMLRWSRQNGVDKVTLEASEDGRRLYESLGFVGTSIMRQTCYHSILKSDTPTGLMQTDLSSAPRCADRKPLRHGPRQSWHRGHLRDGGTNGCELVQSPRFYQSTCRDLLRTDAKSDFSERKLHIFLGSIDV
jgi:GNAT superfamily N-acetyltransferase